MAANKERGELPLHIGGQTYVLKLTSNSACEMETLSGRTFGQILSRLHQGSITDVRLLLWGAMLARHPEITVLEVGELIDRAGGLEEVIKQLDQLLALNTEEASAAVTGTANPPKAQAGTGIDFMSTPVASD